MDPAKHHYAHFNENEKMSLNLEVITLNPNLYNQILCVVVTTPL
jgi:hypothetical protein